MEAKYQGRLELTWTNENKRLLAQPDGAYESPPDLYIYCKNVMVDEPLYRLL